MKEHWLLGGRDSRVIIYLFIRVSDFGTEV